MRTKPKRQNRTTRGGPGAAHAQRDEAVALVLEGVRRLDRGLRLAARQVERRTGLSAAQLFVLEHLSVAEPLSLNELADRTFTDRSSVSVVVDRLIEARLASRTAASGDRRRAEIRITRAGRAMLKRAPTAPTDLLLQALGRLPRTTVERLGKALAQLNGELGFTETEMLFQER